MWTADEVVVVGVLFVAVSWRILSMWAPMWTLEEVEVGVLFAEWPEDVLCLLALTMTMTRPELNLSAHLLVLTMLLMDPMVAAVFLSCTKKM